MVKNFRFEEEGIALSAFPETPEAVDWLHEQGIRTVISLHPVPPEAAARMQERGIEWKPFLIEDWADGVPAGIEALFDYLRHREESDPPTLIHCQGGGGRAGTFYGAYLVSQGVPVEKILTRLPAVGKDVQRAFLHGFKAGWAARGSGG